jgi:hypothetical protein
MVAKAKSGRRSARSVGRRATKRSDKRKSAAAVARKTQAARKTQSGSKRKTASSPRSKSVSGTRRKASRSTPSKTQSRVKRKRVSPDRGRTQSGTKGQITRDHNIIRDWAEQRGGKPSMVEDTQILRLNFDEPGGNDDDRLKEVSWEEFFQVFDDSDLVFLYSEQTAEGQMSRFFKFVREE